MYSSSKYKSNSSSNFIKKPYNDSKVGTNYGTNTSKSRIAAALATPSSIYSTSKYAQNNLYSTNNIYSNSKDLNPSTSSFNSINSKQNKLQEKNETTSIYNIGLLSQPTLNTIFKTTNKEENALSCNNLLLPNQQKSSIKTEPNIIKNDRDTIKPEEIKNLLEIYGGRKKSEVTTNLVNAEDKNLKLNKTWAHSYLEKRREERKKSVDENENVNPLSISHSRRSIFSTDNFLETANCENEEDKPVGGFVERLLKAHHVVDELLNKRGIRAENEKKFLKTFERIPIVQEEEKLEIRSERRKIRRRISLSSETGSEDSGLLADHEFVSEGEEQEESEKITHCLKEYKNFLSYENFAAILPEKINEKINYNIEMKPYEIQLINISINSNFKMQEKCLNANKKIIKPINVVKKMHLKLPASVLLTNYVSTNFNFKSNSNKTEPKENFHHIIASKNKKKISLMVNLEKFINKSFAFNNNNIKLETEKKIVSKRIQKKYFKILQAKLKIKSGQIEETEEQNNNLINSEDISQIKNKAKNCLKNSVFAQKSKSYRKEKEITKEFVKNIQNKFKNKNSKNEIELIRANLRRVSANQSFNSDVQENLSGKNLKTYRKPLETISREEKNGLLKLIKNEETKKHPKKKCLEKSDNNLSLNKKLNLSTSENNKIDVEKKNKKHQNLVVNNPQDMRESSISKNLTLSRKKNLNQDALKNNKNEYDNEKRDLSVLENRLSCKKEIEEFLIYSSKRKLARDYDILSDVDKFWIAEFRRHLNIPWPHAYIRPIFCYKCCFCQTDLPKIKPSIYFINAQTPLSRYVYDEPARYNEFIWRKYLLRGAIKAENRLPYHKSSLLKNSFGISLKKVPKINNNHVAKNLKRKKPWIPKWRRHLKG